MSPLIVTFENKSILINQGLLTRQECWSNLELIKRLHYQRLELEEMMRNTDVVEELKSLDDFWTENQFELQEAWGFDRNAKYHKFWTVPKCECPYMDNEDMYAFQQIINLNCPVHGAKL